MISAPKYARYIRTIPNIVITYAVCCVLSVFLPASPSIGAPPPPDYAEILDYIESNCPPDREIISTVKDVYHERLVFTKPQEGLGQKQELMVLKELDGSSRLVFPAKAIIQVKSSTGGQVAARVIKKFDGPIEPGDPVTLPAAPKIYLSSNIASAHGASAYDDLLQTLLSKDHDVIEIGSASDIADTDGYFLHLRLNISDKQITAKIRSVYTGATLYSKSYGAPEKKQASAAAAASSAGSESDAPKDKGEARPTYQSEQRTAASTDAAPHKAEDFTKAAAPQYHQKVRLPRDFQRLVAAELDGKPPKEIVLLNQEGITAFALRGSALSRLSTYRFKEPKFMGLHLHASDLDQNGTDEILATCGRQTKRMDITDTAIASLALAWQADHFAVLCKDIPFYLRVADPPEGGKILLGQRKKGAEQFAGPIFKVKWNPQTQTLTQGPDYGPASSIHSLYQFIFASGSKERVLILEPDNFVSLYRLPEETLLDATDKNFGPYHEIPYPVRLKEKKYLGEFEGITCRDAFAPRRFLFRKEFQGQCFLIQKGRTESSGMKDKFFNLIGSKKGTDRIVGLRHRSGQIYQTWTSKPVPRDMLDFSFFKQEDGINLLSLVRDSQGYALEIIARKSSKTP